MSELWIVVVSKLTRCQGSSCPFFSESNFHFKLLVLVIEEDVTTTYLNNAESAYSLTYFSILNDFSTILASFACHGLSQWFLLFWSVMRIVVFQSCKSSTVSFYDFRGQPPTGYQLLLEKCRTYPFCNPFRISSWTV